MMANYICGTCSHCAGPVVVHVAPASGKLRIACQQCGAEPMNRYGAVIPMGPVPVSPVARIMQEISKR